MILSDREIRAAIDRGFFRINPVPDESRWSSTAVDLRLDRELTIWQPPANDRGSRTLFYPGDPGFNCTDLINKHAKKIEIQDGGFPLEPKAFVLGWTVEQIQLPHRSRIAARVEGKSGCARLGIGVHVTAPTIHAGFGYDAKKPEKMLPIQLEIFNVGPLTIHLTVGMPICQLIFEEVHGTPEKGYAGKFADQGATLPPKKT